ncbi:hypothetical protein [Agrobacterium rosae]|nr:hypothetical protein [Agrobacterium rosae]
MLKKRFGLSIIMLSLSVCISGKSFGLDNAADIMSRYNAIAEASKSDSSEVRVAVREAIAKCLGKVTSIQAEEITYKIFVDTVEVVSKGLSRQETHSLLNIRLAKTIGPAANGWKKEVSDEVLHFINLMNSDRTSMLCMINESSKRL